MSAQKEWQAHGLKIWETGSDGLERVIADFNQDKYKACRLAAAAPALLEALEEAENYLVSYNGSLPHTDARLIKIRAAIAKAR